MAASITNQLLPSNPTPAQVSAAFNQLVTELIQAQQVLPASPSVTEKVLNFETSSVVADSFPIDVPVGPDVSDVHVAQVISGPTLIANPVTVQWHYLSSGKVVRIDAITGLSPSKHYSIRLSLS